MQVGYTVGMAKTPKAEPGVNIPVRVKPVGLAAVQRVADRDGLSRSEALRRLLKWATEGSPMPKGWH